MVDRMARRQMIFKATEVSIHHFGVTLERENERDIDIDADGYGFANGGHTFLRSGNLDHEVRTADTCPQLFYLGKRRIGVVRNVRADLETHISITTIGLFIQRAE